MTGHYDVPQYADYKKFIAEVYPEAATRIAVTRNGIPVKRKAMKAEIRSQLPGRVIASIPEDDFSKQLKVHATFNAKRASSPSFYLASAVSFYDRDSENDQFQFSCIMLRSSRVDPSQLLHTLSDQSIPRLQMKFNQAAQNPAALHWFVFFHELCHSLISLKMHPCAPQKAQGGFAKAYYYAREETICDSYAVVQTLKIMGESAIPSFRAIADMRLSRLLLSGHKYFTSLAIGEILDAVEGKGMAHLYAMDRDELHDYVLQVSARNYFSPEDFLLLHTANDIVTNADRPLSDFQRHSLTGKVMKRIIELKIDAPAGTYKHKIAKELMRSSGILKKNYAYASLLENLQDKMWPAFRP